MPVRLVSGGGDEHGPAGHCIGSRQRHSTVLKVRFKVKGIVVHNNVGPLAIEGVAGQPEDGVGHVQGGVRAGKWQPGVWCEVVDDFQQCRAFVATATLIRFDFDAAGQVADAPGGSPRINAVGEMTPTLTPVPFRPLKTRTKSVRWMRSPSVEMLPALVSRSSRGA